MVSLAIHAQGKEREINSLLATSVAKLRAENIRICYPLKYRNDPTRRS